MVRRAYARRATVSEIARRVGVLIPTSSVGSLTRQVRNSTVLAQLSTGYFAHILYAWGSLASGTTRSPLLDWG